MACSESCTVGTNNPHPRLIPLRKFICLFFCLHVRKRPSSVTVHSTCTIFRITILYLSKEQLNMLKEDINQNSRILIGLHSRQDLYTDRTNVLEFTT